MGVDSLGHLLYGGGVQSESDREKGHMMRKQTYILPTPDGWAVVSYGDGLIPDDEMVPLPLTSAVGFADVVEFVAGTPLGTGGFIDGWATRAELAELEPELYARAF